MNLKLKKENLPLRCEICHKTDLFDASNNLCQRCNDVVIQYNEILIKKIPNVLTLHHRCQIVATIIGISLLTTGLLLGAFFGSLTGKLLESWIFPTSTGHTGTALGMFPGLLLASFLMVKLAKNFASERKIKLVPFLAQQLEYLIKN